MSSSEAEPAEEPPEEPGADNTKEEPLEEPPEEPPEDAKSKSSESAEERECDVDMHGPADDGEASPAQKSDDTNMSPSLRRAAPACPPPPSGWLGLRPYLDRSGSCQKDSGRVP